MSKKNEGELIAITDVKVDWRKLFDYCVCWLMLDVILWSKKGRGKGSKKPAQGFTQKSNPDRKSQKH